MKVLPGRICYIACGVAALALFASCNVVKRLKPGQELYTGAEVVVRSNEKMELKHVKKELNQVLTPKPNQTIFGIRFKLWFYQVAGEDPKKGFKKMLKYKLGEKPVLFDPNIPVHVSDILVNRLHNMGYFEADVKYEVHNKNKKTTITYSAQVTRPYTIAEIKFPEGDDGLAYAINYFKDKTLIRPGMRYDLNLFKNERSRIDQDLKEHGYYYFSPDHLLFRADTTAGSKTVRLRLEIKKDVPAKALIPYKLNDIYIYSSHRLRDSTARRRPVDTVLVDGYHYIRRDSAFKPRAITRAILLRKDEKYSRKAHSSSLTRLMSMGNFHYVNIRFNDTLAGDTGKLNAHIYLTPMQKRSVMVELQAVTKSNNYTGPAFTLSYKNRNLFRGAELLVLNFNTNYETQFTGLQKGFNSYELGGNAQLFIPKFIVPFPIRNLSTTYIPKTKFELGFRNLNRVLYFKMVAINFSFGYTWKETPEKEHELNPFAVNFAKVMKSTETFADLLQANPFLRRTFEEQFTFGGNYAFTYNGIVNSPRRDKYYFNGMIDLSGNMLYLIHQAIYQRKPTFEQPFFLFNFRYAQFSKLTVDGRHYHDINKNSKIASRLMAGVGVPYGNSRSLPYIKQFFSGGSNSIRAFLPRTIGPGVYVSSDSASRRAFLDQSGDIKIEGNLEYRFTMISLLKGALFLDAGNIWLFRDNEQLPGGRFDLKRFHREFAVGTGFGLRIDITYFVLRFDLGMPLRKPYLTGNGGWVTRDIAFGSRSWRRSNLVLNIAIGYPF